jgi:hypothetical protein
MGGLHGVGMETTFKVRGERERERERISPQCLGYS